MPIYLIMKPKKTPRALTNYLYTQNWVLALLGLAPDSLLTIGLTHARHRSFCCGPDASSPNEAKVHFWAGRVKCPKLIHRRVDIERYLPVQHQIFLNQTILLSVVVVVVARCDQFHVSCAKSQKSPGDKKTITIEWALGGGGFFLLVGPTTSE